MFLVRVFPEQGVEHLGLLHMALGLVSHLWRSTESNLNWDLVNSF